MIKLKAIVIVSVLFFAMNYIFTENILLKDGRSYKGKIVEINKKKIAVFSNNEIIEFDINVIDYVVYQVSQDEYSTVLIKTNNGFQQKAYLIKFTDSVLYYKNLNESELRLIKLSSIYDISLLNQKNINISNVIITKINQDVTGDINKDFENLIVILSKTKNKSLNSSINITEDEKDVNAKNDPIDIESADFYEKFWAKINKYVDMNTENLMWNLLEDYSDKEKSMNLIYNEGLTGIKKKSDESNIKIKIKKLRNDFYKRAKKILLASTQ